MNIILGVSGSIAAYKAAALTRLWVKQQAEVQVLMTESAKEFITPLSLSTLSKRPVFSSVVSESGWNNHVELGLWADAMIVAPATANTLAKLANGLCDNIVGAVYLSARCPVFIAPAMDLDMWHHPATRRNLALLESAGAHIIPVGHGELASGLIGDGRMAEPEDIVTYVTSFFQHKQDLVGKKALVTAGPTHEPIDPVRFIGNHSSGKMGIAIAENLAERGAEVRLVLGPTPLRPKHSHIQTIAVQSAQDMYEACQVHFPEADYVVLAAAVADYKVKTYSDLKIKKKEGEMTLELAKTIDIASTLSTQKRPGQIVVGFALETNDAVANARLKLERKGFDFIVLNSMQDAGAGFGHDTNKISILFPQERSIDYPLKSKKAVASDIVDQIAAIGNPGR